ncbi:MAG: hypothetical protein AAFU55_14770, partial [Pseudomonadota bacterium]
VGGGVLVAGLALWAGAGERPEVLIAPEGRLVGVLGDQGRAVDHKSSASYAASIWLRRDGDGAAQEDAALRWESGARTVGDTATLSNGWRLTLVPDRRIAAAALADRCGERTVLIAPFARIEVDGACIFFGRDRLEATGALSLSPSGSGLAIATAAERAGRRYWSMPGGFFARDDRLGRQ